MRGARVDSLCDLVERKTIGHLLVTEGEQEEGITGLADLSPYFAPARLDRELVQESRLKKITV